MPVPKVFRRVRCTRGSGRLIGAAAAMSLALTAVAQQVPVLQRGYDAGVTGANLQERVLNTANVTASTFGLVFKLPVDDVIFAQPLYVPNVAIPNMGMHNVVYVATMSDTLYAFDADAGGAPLWSVNFASLVGATPVPMANFAFKGNKNIVGNLGILSTPVIDASTHILYLVACTLENNTLAYRLHAVDITDGTEPHGPGVLISGSYGGTTFDARPQLQRVSLALAGNQVVFGFSAMQLEFAGGFVGWVMAYNKTTLQQSGIFATVTTGNRGAGVWQSGRPPVVDAAGYVYVFTGNAFGGGYDGVRDFSESALKLDPAHGLKLIDWFTPGTWSFMDTYDRDLSASGPLMIPGTTLIAGGGKTGDLYIVDTTNLGKFNANDSQIVQKEHITPRAFRGGPVFWKRSAANGGGLLYNWGVLDSIKAYPFDGTRIATSPSSQGSSVQLTPGGILTLSANGEQSGSGVLWATVTTSGDTEDNPPVPGELQALDAEHVSQVLWTSAMNPARDEFGDFAKFVPPLVVNGKVYVATWSDQVAVYGLLAPYAVSPTSLAFGNEPVSSASAPMRITVTNTGTAVVPISGIALSGTDSADFSQTNTCGNSVALGSSCTISVVFKPATVGSKTATLNVTAGGTPVAIALSGMAVISVSVKASAATLTVGQAATVTWVATSGATCSASGGSPADGWSGSIAASGTKKVTEVKSGTYLYRVGCALGSQTQQAQAAVVFSWPPVTATLTASPTTINAGQATTLTWSSANASSCQAAGGGAGDGWSGTGTKAPSGSASVTETSTSATALTLNFVLTCTSAASGQSVQASASVVENAPPAAAKSGGGGSFDGLSLLVLLGLGGRVCRRQRPKDAGPLAKERSCW